MKNKNKFINNPRLRSWVAVMLFAFLGIFLQYSPSFSQNPEWIAYDIGPVYFVTSLASEKDTLWIGTLDSGLIKLNKITREYSTYNLKDLGFKYNFVESIVVDKRGYKWLGTSDGLIKFDGTNWTLYDSLGRYSSTVDPAIIKLDKSGNLWVKGDNNLAIFDGADWTVYDRSDSTLLYYGVGRFAFDSLGHLWGGTDNGLKEFDDSNWTLHNANNHFKFNDYYIGGIEIGKNGIKWVISVEPMSGYCDLVRFINDSNWAVYNAWDNKPDIMSYSIGFLTVDSDNSIWIGAGNLAWFDGNETWKNYTFRHGDSDVASTITIDEYGNKWVAISGGYPGYFPNYIVVFRDGGVKLGIDGEATILPRTIFPNPTRDYINTAAYLGWQYQIYDLLGSCVQSGMIDAENINVTSLPTGFYTVRFFKEGKQVMEKMMKE